MSAAVVYVVMGHYPHADDASYQQWAVRAFLRRADALAWSDQAAARWQQIKDAEPRWPRHLLAHDIRNAARWTLHQQRRRQHWAEADNAFDGHDLARDMYEQPSYYLIEVPLDAGLVAELAVQQAQPRALSLDGVPRKEGA